MTKENNIDQLVQQFSELWQEQIRKTLTDPLLQKMSYEMMGYFKTHSQGRENSTVNNETDLSTENTETFRKPETTPIDSFDCNGTMGTLLARIEACENKIAFLESLLKSKPSI